MTEDPTPLERPAFNAAVVRRLNEAVADARPSTALHRAVSSAIEAPDVSVLLTAADFAAVPTALRTRVAAMIGAAAAAIGGGGMAPVLLVPRALARARHAT